MSFAGRLTEFRGFENLLFLGFQLRVDRCLVLETKRGPFSFATGFSSKNFGKKFPKKKKNFAPAAKRKKTSPRREKKSSRFFDEVFIFPNRMSSDSKTFQSQIGAVSIGISRLLLENHEKKKRNPLEMYQVNSKLQLISTFQKCLKKI